MPAGILWFLVLAYLLLDSALHFLAGITLSSVWCVEFLRLSRPGVFATVGVASPVLAWDALRDSLVEPLIPATRRESLAALADTKDPVLGPARPGLADLFDFLRPL